MGQRDNVYMYIRLHTCVSAYKRGDFGFKEPRARASFAAGTFGGLCRGDKRSRARLRKIHPFARVAVCAEGLRRVESRCL